MQITWNLRMLCAQKGAWTGAELGRRLRARVGVEVSASTLSNLLTKRPRAVAVNMLLALCAALDCTPNDLLVVDLAPNKRASERLVAELTRANRARAPKKPATGRRRRRTPPPPSTRI